jgi:peptidoglycan hydrolase CwlO-like protein
MRFDRIERKLSEHDEEFRKLNKQYDHLLNTIDSFVGRIDKYETELSARDHKIDRLERWIEQIALKTNFKLV